MKLLCWNCHRLGNPATVGELRQLLATNNPNIIFLSETKLRNCDIGKIQRRCNMSESFVVDSNRSKGGLMVLWDEDTHVDIQTYSLNHVNMFVKGRNFDKFCFIGIYGYLERGQRHLTWSLIQDIGSRVNEEWVIGRDFNETLDDFEKHGGRRKMRVAM